jgi:hypothetical protein
MITKHNQRILTLQTLTVDQQNASNGKINWIIAKKDYERNKKLYEERNK